MKYLMGGIAFALSLAGPSAAWADTPPHVDHAYAPQPGYPDSAQSAGEQGDVVLRVYVGANGVARGIRLVKSSGFHDLDMSAAEGVIHWRYVPAMSDGEPHSDWMQVKVHYELPPPVQGTAPPSATSQLD